jgi:hypothetical protein
MLLKNGINLNDRLLDFIQKSNNLSIYIPYIKLAQLKHLLQSYPSIEIIIVRWEPKDLILASSDLDIYPFLREREIKLYRNPRLHLKAFVDDNKTAFIGSANISQRALNFPEAPNYNYELGVVVENLSLSDRLYFQIIEAESTLITKEIYNTLAEQISIQKAKIKVEDNFSFDFNYLIANFLISSLPMSYDVEILKKIYIDETSNNAIALNCALHDLAIYQIPFGLTEEDFVLQLKSSFFKHPFIRAFLANLDELGSIYFGNAKEWVHRNCSDAPTPRKWEITANIQIFYRWIVSLSDGVYEVDRPNYSERLFKVTPQDEHISYLDKFINELKRDKAHGGTSPHQIILLISFFNLGKHKLNIDELILEFDKNWEKYKDLFKSTNRNIGMPLKAMMNKKLINLETIKPIQNYRDVRGIYENVRSVSLSEDTINFLKKINLSHLIDRIQS